MAEVRTRALLPDGALDSRELPDGALGSRELPDGALMDAPSVMPPAVRRRKLRALRRRKARREARFQRLLRARRREQRGK